MEEKTGRRNLSPRSSPGGRESLLCSFLSKETGRRGGELPSPRQSCADYLLPWRSLQHHPPTSIHPTSQAPGKQELNPNLSQGSLMPQVTLPGSDLPQRTAG